MLVFYAVRSSSKPAVNAGGGTVSAARKRVYPLLAIDTSKNRIPTGTELTVLGKINGEALISMEASLDPTCYWYMVNGHANVQHGDDPRLYCNFPVLLTDSEDGGTSTATANGGTRLASMLTCNMNAPSFKKLQSYIKDAHSNQIPAMEFHGYYSSTLDFATMASVPGAHLGLPMMDNCTFIAHPGAQ
jgi:hypothetical protein